MRVRTLALALGVAALSLASVTAFADEGGWRHEGRERLQWTGSALARCGW